MKKLPTPRCRYGYPDDQLIEILGNHMSTFNRWMRGQTIAGCDGREYDYDAKQYVQTGCGPHGFVTYKWDVEIFLAGLPVID